MSRYFILSFFKCVVSVFLIPISNLITNTDK